jgi:ABC-type cobalt transport system substrate-binding protein
MPSQEEYLDNLLKEMMNEQNEQKTTEEPVPEEVEIPIPEEKIPESEEEISVPEETALPSENENLAEGEEDSDSDGGILGDMSEEDIDKMLDESSKQGDNMAEGMSSVELSQDELADLLAIAGDDEDLNDIQDMLQKADNNEAIDEDTLELLNSLSGDNTQIPDADDDNPQESKADKKAKKAEEKRKKKEEKKAARQQAKEEKKALAEAKKLAKTQDKPIETNTEAGGENEGDGLSVTQNDDNTDISMEMDALLNDALNPIAENIVTAEPSDSAETTGNTDTNAPSPDEEASVTDESISLENADEVLADNSAAPAKKGFFAKILDLLTQEDEEEEPKNKENEDIMLSDENQSIIEELDNETDDPKKGKKGKKAKKEKKPKKDKKADKKDKGSEATKGDEESDKDGEDKGKKKKEKKPKKEKAEGEQADKKPGKKLSTKRIGLIALVCLSLLIVIILITNLTGEYSDKQAGRRAFTEGDYQTCYQNLYGKKLDETEQVMFSKSECILRIRLWIREYEMLVEEGEELEALDSLIQSVNDYPALYEYASQWNSVGDVAEGYSEILSILSQKYGLDEAQAKDIAAIEDDIDYTAAIADVCEGKGYISSDAAETETSTSDNSTKDTAASEELKDALPEEQNMVNADYVDNMPH